MSADPARLAEKYLKPTWLFAGAVVLSIPFLLYVHRDIGVWADEWTFLINHYGFSPDALFTHQNGQAMIGISVILTLVEWISSPGAIWPLAVLSVISQVLVAWAAFAYMRRTANDWFALFAAVLILLFGMGWETIIWSFNMGWVLGTAAGIAALILFETREDTRSTVLASLLLVCGLACGGIAAPFAIAIGLYVVWPDTRWRAVKVLAAPAVLYALWMFTYGSDFHHSRDFLGAPAAFYTLASYGFGGLFGIGQDFGRPIFVVAVVGVLVAFARSTTIDRRVLAALLLPVSLWLIIGIERSNGIADFASSRYMYSSAIMILLAGSHFVRFIRPTPELLIAALFFFALTMVAQLGHFQSGARTMRGWSASTEAFATAMRVVDREDAISSRAAPGDPGLLADPASRASTYDWLAKKGDAVTVAPSEIAAQVPPVRNAIDSSLVQLTRATVTEEDGLPDNPGKLEIQGGVPPAKIVSSGCVRVDSGKPPVAVSAGAAGIVVDGKARVAVQPMRFADAPTTGPKAKLAPGVHGFAMNPGKLDLPWRYLLRSTETFTVCAAQQ